MNEAVKKVLSAAAAAALAASLLPAPAPAAAAELSAAPPLAAQAGNSLSRASVKLVRQPAYTGRVVKPSLAVRIAGKKLASKSYKVAYLDSKKRPIAPSKVKKPGTYYAVLEGARGYTGKKAVKFKVARLAAAAKTAKYTGRAVKPSLAVTIAGKKLASKSYKVGYLDSMKRPIAPSKVKKPGTYYARVSGKGAYKGASATAKFKVYSKGGKKWGTVYKKAWVKNWVTEVVKPAYYEPVTDAVSTWIDTATCSAETGKGTSCVLGTNWRRLYLGDAEDWSRLMYFDPNDTPMINNKTRFPTTGDSVTLGYDISDMKDYIKMPSVIADFFYREHDLNPETDPETDPNASTYGPSAWSQLAYWAIDDNFDSEEIATWALCAYDPAFGTIELDEDWNWNLTEAQKKQRAEYVEALETVMPKLKKALAGSVPCSTVGTGNTAYVLTSYKVVHHSAVTRKVDEGYYRKVAVGKGWV